MKKYELVKDDQITYGEAILYRIKACRDFTCVNGFEVQKGDLGGYIESEKNLSHEGNCWISDNAWVADNARVIGNARVTGNARVKDNAWVRDNVLVGAGAIVGGNAWISNNKGGGINK